MCQASSIEKRRTWDEGGRSVNPLNAGTYYNFKSWLKNVTSKFAYYGGVPLKSGTGGFDSYAEGGVLEKEEGCTCQALKVTRKADLLQGAPG